MTAGRKSATPPVATRRERRAAQRAERGTPRAQSRGTTKTPLWRSPIVALTVVALVLGGLIVVYAVSNQPHAASDTLQAPIADVPAGQADGRTLGSASAPVTVEIWSDFQCPSCRTLATGIEPSIISQYVVPGYARLVYHDAAFQGRKVSSSWDESAQAAAGARCAADQGRFWEMHDWLFANWAGENQGGFAPARLRTIAQSAELDMTAYDACMAVGDKQDAVKAETNLAVTDGINSTPTIFINGTQYVGATTVKDLGVAIMAAAGGASPAPTQAALSDSSLTALVKAGQADSSGAH